MRDRRALNTLYSLADFKRYLWTIFKPGRLVYMPETDSLFELKAAEYKSPIFEAERFKLTLSWVTWTGDKFCLASTELEVENFQGTRGISKLPAYPVEYHSSPKELKNRLIIRGKRYFQLKGIHHKAYGGQGDIYENIVKEGRYGSIERSAVKVSRAVSQPTAANENILPNYNGNYSLMNAS